MGPPLTLRVINVTDVYKLDNFPHLRTLIQQKRREIKLLNPSNKLVTILTGDFLAPYLLSSVDKGVSMVNMMNATPVDYVIMGNHEDDLAHIDTCARIREIKGIFVNSNMPDHAEMAHMQETAIVGLGDATHSRKVGLVGVLSDSPALYKQNAFGGATLLDPWECLQKFKKQLEDEDHCDVVLPLCHLYEPQDLRTQKEFDFPVILSGHDHHRVDKTISGSRLLKAGADANYAVVLDMTWESREASKEPVVRAETIRVDEFEADPKLVEQMNRAVSILDHLAHTQLCIIPDDCKPLSSVGSRTRPVTIGRFLWSRLRDTLCTDDNDATTCDCVIISGGNIRGGTDYADDAIFSLASLKSEIQESLDVVIVPVPGAVLRVCVRESRGRPNPGFLQHDDGVQLDSDGYVTHICGEPLESERLYRVGTSMWDIQEGTGVSLVEFVREHPETMPQAEWPVLATLMDGFAKHVWKTLFANVIDKDGDGRISMEEFNAVDTDGDGMIGPSEVLALMKRIGLRTDGEELSFVREVIEAAGDANQDGLLSPQELGVEQVDDAARK